MLKRKQSKTLHLISLCLLVLICGCSGAISCDVPSQPTHEPTVKTSDTLVLFSDELCAAPCWQGITPGVSDKEHIVHILEQLEIQGRIYRYTESSEDSHYYVDVQGGYIDIVLENGRVEYIWGLYPDITDYRVHHVIERLGEPEAITPCHNLPKVDRSCETENASGVDDPPEYTYLLYPSLGATFTVALSEVYRGFICPEMQTMEFYFYQPRSLADALNESKSPVFRARRDYSSEELCEWHGYGQGY